MRARSRRGLLESCVFSWWKLCVFSWSRKLRGPTTSGSGDRSVEGTQLLRAAEASCECEPAAAYQRRRQGVAAESLSGTWPTAGALDSALCGLHAQTLQFCRCDLAGAQGPSPVAFPDMPPVPQLRVFSWPGPHAGCRPSDVGRL